MEHLKGRSFGKCLALFRRGETSEAVKIPLPCSPSVTIPVLSLEAFEPTTMAGETAKEKRGGEGKEMGQKFCSLSPVQGSR